MNDYEFWNFYDYEKAEEIRANHCKKGMDLVRRFIKAKEKGNPQAIKRAVKAMAKHKEDGEQMKAWADETGFYWY